MAIRMKALQNSTSQWRQNKTVISPTNNNWTEENEKKNQHSMNNNF